MSNIQNNEASNEHEQKLDDDLTRSDRELIHLGNFYHERGYVAYAQEIYRALFKMRSERNHLSKENAEDREDEAG